MQFYHFTSFLAPSTSSTSLHTFSCISGCFAITYKVQVIAVDVVSWPVEKELIYIYYIICKHSPYNMQTLIFINYYVLRHNITKFHTFKQKSINFITYLNISEPFSILILCFQEDIQEIEVSFSLSYSNIFILLSLKCHIKIYICIVNNLSWMTRSLLNFFPALCHKN